MLIARLIGTAPNLRLLARIEAGKGAQGEKCSTRSAGGSCATCGILN